MAELLTIQQALREMRYAEALRKKADEIDYRAKKQLEGLYSSAVPPLDKKTNKALEKRLRSAYRVAQP